MKTKTELKEMFIRCDNVECMKYHGFSFDGKPCVCRPYYPQYKEAKELTKIINLEGFDGLKKSGLLEKATLLIMKYAIFGNGWLGSMLKDYLQDAFIISQPIQHGWGIGQEKVWINTAAKTDIDWCEKNKWEAFDTNVLGAVELAKDAKEYGKKYVFFSSACVFESRDQYDIKMEDDIPNPQCWYSWTKAVAEQLILEANPDALIIRLRVPISEKKHPRNTLDKLSKYPFINDNQESWTIVEDMFPVLKELIDENQKGIFHLINKGTMSPAEVAEAMGHSFTMTSKQDQDIRMASEGRAKRVTAYIGSTRIPLLPNIRQRIPEVIAKWKQ